MYNKRISTVVDSGGVLSSVMLESYRNIATVVGVSYVNMLYRTYVIGTAESTSILGYSVELAIRISLIEYSYEKNRFF